MNLEIVLFCITHTHTIMIYHFALFASLSIALHNIVSKVIHYKYIFSSFSNTVDPCEKRKKPYLQIKSCAVSNTININNDFTWVTSAKYAYWLLMTTFAIFIHLHKHTHTKDKDHIKQHTSNYYLYIYFSFIHIRHTQSKEKSTKRK